MDGKKGWKTWKGVTQGIFFCIFEFYSCRSSDTCFTTALSPLCVTKTSKCWVRGFFKCAVSSVKQWLIPLCNNKVVPLHYWLIKEINEMTKEHVSHGSFSFKELWPGRKLYHVSCYWKIVLDTGCTFSLREFSSNTLFQECPSWLMVTENSVTIIGVSSDVAPCVTTPVMRLTAPKSTCSHSCGLLYWVTEKIFFKLKKKSFTKVLQNI